jgi:hypothetical protein
MDRVENTVCSSTSIVACVPVAAGRCLPSRCLETALVYLRISRSLHSNGPARYNTDLEHYPYRDLISSSKGKGKVVPN